MQEDRDYSVYPSDLDMLTAFKAFNQYLSDNNYEGGLKTSNEHDFMIEVNPHRRLNAENFKEFLQSLERHPDSLPLRIHSYWKKKKDIAFSSIISVSRSGLKVSVRSDDLDIVSAVHDKIKDCFHASNPQLSQTERLSKYNLKKSIFLAHRFDDEGNSAAQTLEKFLVRLGFDVKEGSGYEAKDIPEKISSKIKSQDIFICLVTPGISSWIISEAAFAKALNKYLIVICQENVDFIKGIIGGDYEHLTFSRGFIEKCFSDLLYALPL